MEYDQFLVPFHFMPSQFQCRPPLSTVFMHRYNHYVQPQVPYFYHPLYVPTHPIRPQNEQNSIQERKKGRIIRWTFPEPGFLKLNTDGSSYGNPGPASYGGLIRDESGKWVCGYMGKLGHETSLDDEVWSIFKGLSLVKEMGLKKVLIETDCMGAFLLIFVDQIDEKHPQKSLIEECRLIMKTNHCLMIHTLREGNHCADKIAKSVSSKMEYDQFLVPFHCVPSQFQCRPPLSTVFMHRDNHYVQPQVPYFYHPLYVPTHPIRPQNDENSIQERKKGRTIRWTFSSPAYLKLNTDGSSYGNSGNYGGLIRDESGKWVCGFLMLKCGVFIKNGIEESFDGDRLHGCLPSYLR